MSRVQITFTLFGWFYLNYIVIVRAVEIEILLLLNFCFWLRLRFRCEKFFHVFYFFQSVIKALKSFLRLSLFHLVFILHFVTLWLTNEKPSSLKVEIWSPHVDVGLCNWRDILLLFHLFFQSSRFLVDGRMLLMASDFLVQCKYYKTLLT